MGLWITIGDEGSWDYAGQRFRGPGSWEVDEHVADEARLSGYAWLVVTERRVTLVSMEQPSGPLTSADFLLEGAGVKVEEAISERILPALERDAEDRIPCPHRCGKTYASEPALARHLEVVHAEQEAPF